MKTVLLRSVVTYALEMMWPVRPYRRRTSTPLCQKWTFQQKYNNFEKKFSRTLRSCHWKRSKIKNSKKQRSAVKQMGVISVLWVALRVSSPRAESHLDLKLSRDCRENRARKTDYEKSGHWRFFYSLWAVFCPTWRHHAHVGPCMTPLSPRQKSVNAKVYTIFMTSSIVMHVTSSLHCYGNI